MKIEAFITEKLYQGEAVKVEGLGTFKTSPKPTSIHPGDHRFDPPGRKLEFSFDPETKDEGFATFIADKTSEDEQEILQEIRKRSATISEELKAGKKVQLQNMGFLYYDFRGEVKLDADQALNFSKQNFGLPAFNAELITHANQKPEEKEAEKQETKAAAKPEKKRPEQRSEPAKAASQKKKKTTPADTAKPKSKQGKKQGKKTAAWLVPLALVLLVGAAAWYFRDDWQKWFEKPMTTTAEQEKEITKEPVADTARKQEQKAALADTISQDTATAEVKSQMDSEQQPAKTDKAASTGQEVATGAPQASAGDYLIIAGCFESMENADEFVQELNQKGFEASIQGTTPHGLHRVVYGVYDKRRNAVNALNRIRAGENEGAWLDRY